MLDDGLHIEASNIRNEARGTKKCSTCLVEKPIQDFTRNKNQPSGYMCYCKACNNERNKRYRRDTNNVSRACKRVYGYLSRRVKDKGLEVDFASDFLEELYFLQSGVCAYTGDKMSLEAGLPSTLSVDRLDSSIGYTKDNVRLVTWEVNNAKQSRSMDEFILLCQKVVDNGKV